MANRRRYWPIEGGRKHCSVLTGCHAIESRGNLFKYTFIVSIFQNCCCTTNTPLLRDIQAPLLRAIQALLLRDIQAPLLRAIQAPLLRAIQALLLRDIQALLLRDIQALLLRDCIA
jgi:hypothetical protein